MNMDTLFDSVYSPPITYDEWARIGHMNGWLGVRGGDAATSRAPLLTSLYAQDRNATSF